MDSVAVLVVGAGPVGLTLAAALDRCGVPVTVVDRAAHSKREARAAVVWPRAAEVLDDVGVSAISDRAQQLHEVEIHARGLRLGSLDLGHLDGAHRFPLVIEQHDTERLLVDALAARGVPVQWNTELTGLRQRDGYVEAHLEAPDGGVRVVEAAWVVGCEGTRSRVRTEAGIEFAGRVRPDLQVLQINAEPKWRYRAGPNRGWFFLEPRASLGVFALPAGGYRFFCFTTDDNPSVTAPPTAAEMRELVARLTHQPDLDLTPTEPLWVNRARFADRVATHLRRGRVLLAGDAAHAWAPIGGHGMNAGMRGAHNLAWKLAAVHAGHAHDSVLDTYDSEQRAAAHAVMDEMRFNVLELPLPPLAFWPVAAALPLALAARPVRRRVERTLSDLDMHHRRSPLSCDTAGRPGPRAGDRLPDVPVQHDRGATTTHALLDYGRWTLLAEPEADPVQLRQILDRYRATVQIHVVSAIGPDATTARGRDGTLLLVRPDRHIGLRATGDAAQVLDGYCATHFPRRP